MNDTPGGQGETVSSLASWNAVSLDCLRPVPRWKHVAADCAGIDRGESKLPIQYLFAR